MARKVLGEFRDLVSNSQLTGTIQNVSSDLFSALKGFVGDLIAINTPTLPKPITVAQKNFADICAINGIEYREDFANFYESYIYGKFNIVSGVTYNVEYDYKYYDKLIVIGNLDMNGNARYVINGDKLDRYSVSPPIYSYVNSSISFRGDIIMLYINSGVLKNYRTLTNTTVSTDILTSLSNTKYIYSSYVDLVADNSYSDPISTTGDYVFIPGVEKVWDKYGNLDNLGVGTATGVISGDVVGTDTWERVIRGSIALEDILPFPLVDTKENVLIDDAYVDDNVDDTPYENVDYGDIGDYTMGGIVTSVFPFCIPFDLIRLFRVVSSSAEAPRWELPLNVPMLNFSYTFVIDLAPFEQLASIFRIMETIMFIIGLILATRKLIGD